MKKEKQKIILKLFKDGIYYCEKDGSIYSRHNFRHGLHPKRYRLMRGRYYPNNRYGEVGLTIKKGIVIRAKIHQVMCLYFKGEYPEGMQINHIDGNKINNRIENLEIVTPKENYAHAKKMGLIRITKGEEHFRAKLTEGNVLKMRQMYKTGKYFHRELAEKFGVTKSVATRAISGTTWKHVK